MSQSQEALICIIFTLLAGASFVILFVHYQRKLQKLSETEQELQRLKAFANGLPDLVALIDEDFQIIDIITHKDRETYRPVDEIIGQTLRDIFPFETASIIENVVSKTIVTGSIQIAEHSLLYPNGLRWFEGRSLPLPGNSIEKAKILWVTRDITDRKMTEQALSGSEARFRSIFEYSPVGILTADTDGFITNINDAYLRIIGDSGLRNEIVGKHNLLENIIFKSAGVQNKFLEFYSEKEPFIAEAHLISFVGRAITVRYHGSPQLDETGNFIGCVLICEEITEQNQANESLRQSELRYRTISELISDFACSFLIDEQMKVSTEWVTASFERMTGYSVDEIFAEGAWSKVVHREDLSKINDLFQMLFTKPSDKTIQIRIHNKHDELRHIQVYFRSIWDNKLKRISQILAAGSDITEQIQVAVKDKELAAHRQQVELLNNFIGNMSHHFKNPMSVVSTELALIQSLQIHHVEAHIKKIELQIAHINHIFGKLSTLAQLDHNPDFMFEDRDLNFVLLELEVSLLHIASKRNINLHIDVPENIPRLTLDDHWLSKALFELVDNALFHSPDDGNVYVIVSVETPLILIAIQDEGEGIAEKHLPHVFQRFYKTDEARTDVERPGIGLTIASEVVKAHGGTLTVESEIGKGSTFTVNLPISKADQ